MCYVYNIQSFSINIFSKINKLVLNILINKIKMYKYIINIIILGISFSQFGQNIVQYDDFNWHYIQSEHFDIYYYDDGKQHAEYVAFESENSYDNISEKLNWELKNRVSIIVHNSHNDFQQTNVIDSYMFEGIGGVTELYKNRIVIPFDGSHKEFKHVIHHELVHAFINDYIYGGNIQNLISNQVKAYIPLWMNEGLAEYLSGKWNTNSDMWMRDLAINSPNLPQIPQLLGYMAYRGGQSVWNFITEKWGEESISEIFYQIKAKDNVEMCLKNALGVNLEQLTEQWHTYLKKEYWPEINKRENLESFSRRLTNNKKLKNTYNISPSLSPDGSQIPIISNKSGTMGIYLISAEDGRFIRQIVKGERSAEYEELHILKPGLTWSPDGKKIAFAAKSGDSDALFLIDIKTEKVEKFKFDMEGIFRASWNPVKDQIAFIGNNGIQSDIYIYDLSSDSLNNITNDWFSDDQISWSSDGEYLLFISDRGDYLNQKNPNDFKKHSIDQMDIYELNIFSKQIYRITNTPHNEAYPLYTNDLKKIIFTSDEYGINNLNIMDLKSSKTFPITNLMTGLSQLSWNTTNSHLLFSGFENNGYDIYMMQNPLSRIDNNIKIEKAKWLSKPDSIPLIISDINEEKNNENISYKNYIFSNNYYNNKEEKKSKNNFLPISELVDSSGSYISHHYKTRFTLDLIQGQAYTTSLYSPNAMIQFIFSDILGNHKIYFGTEMQISIENSDYFLLYRLLPYKTDYNFMISHQAEHYQMFGTGEIARYRNFGIGVNALRPLSRFQRFEFGIDYNYIEHANFTPIQTQYNTTNYSSKRIINILNTAMPSIGYTWDNTLWSQMFPIDGIRAHAKINFSPKINENSLNFTTLSLDLRKYIPIGNGISFASKLYLGTSIGENAQNFLLGGVPWLVSSEESIYANNPMVSDNSLENIFISEYVMPVRGTQINEISGKKTVLLNAELRLPFLIYYFPSIKYLGQINGVIFTDIGAAWSENKIDFWEGESWNSDPKDFVWTYGFGPRFIFLGLPFKLDYGWEYHPTRKSNRMWYLSVGLDY